MFRVQAYLAHLFSFQKMNTELDASPQRSRARSRQLRTPPRGGGILRSSRSPRRSERRRTATRSRSPVLLFRGLTRPVHGDVSVRVSRHRSPEPTRCRITSEHQRSRSRSRHTPRDGGLSPRSRRGRTRSSSRQRMREFFTQFTNFIGGSSSNTNRDSFPNINVVPEFDPSKKNQTIHIWLTKVNECARMYGWSERQIIHYALPKLSGVAKKWYEGLPSVLFSWSEWQVKLKSAFPTEENYGQMLSDMLDKKARYGESLEDYYYEKMSLINRCNISGKKAVECVLYGIEDRFVRMGAEAAQFSDPDRLLAYLRNVKVRKQEKFKRNEGKDVVRSADNVKRHSLKCFNCKGEGHTVAKCNKPIKRCSYCSLVGHLESECFRSKNREASNSKTVMLIYDEPKHVNNKYVQTIFVNGCEKVGFIDLGSELTLIRESDAKEIFGKWDATEIHPMLGFGGSIVNSIGSSVGSIKIQNVTADVRCVIVPDVFLKYPLLIGQTFSEQPHVRIVKNNNNLIITDKYNFDNIVIRKLGLRVVEDTTITGDSTIRVYSDSEYDGSIYIHNSYRTQPNREYSVEEGVYQIEKGLCSILVSSLTNSAFKFCKDELIARAEIVLDSFGFYEINRIDSKVQCEPFRLEQLNIGDVSDEDKYKLLTLINKYRDCFASSLNELGCTNIEEMAINLNDDHPVVHRPYRLSQKERLEVQSMVDDMCGSGVIRESNSPYASPIVLVTKKTGDKRLCVDYRALNKKTLKQHYPLPCMEDQLNRLTGNRFYCTLDLASGYYQIPLSEESKPKTAFVTPDGQWEFNRMPFGLANAPAVFQRTVNKALGTLRFSTAVAYMDDVLVPSIDVNDGLKNLEIIFQKFREANLTLNLAKCHFFETSVEFLGFEVTINGIRPGAKKIAAVRDFPLPKNVHNVRQFIGLASFFRKFIKNFASLARPLTKLLKKNSPWLWGQEQQQAFSDLKDKLVSRPLLALYNSSLHTELHTDASKWGVGGILLQKQDCGNLKPVAYFSRQTSPEEQHFSAYELETLAVVSSLVKFRSYLLGMPFTIVTDCNSLRATFVKRDMVPRVARWWSVIQEFDCDVVYKPGRSMCHVDALSRNPIPGNYGLIEGVEFPSILTINEDWIKTVQSGDDEIRRIKDILLDSNSNDIVNIKQNYCIKSGNVYKLTDDGEKWLVPKGVRWQILKTCHDDIGHFSTEKTLDKIKKDYWFPKMRKFVKKYVQSCLECAHSKVPSGRKSGELHPIPKISKPFHTLHADHLGPFNPSKNKNKYILVIVDAYSKFIYLKAVKSTKASTTIKILREYFGIFGLPTRLITDRHSTFTGKKLRDFLNNLSVKHVMNAVATPRANGQVERYNRTILDSLTAMNHGRDESLWDDKIIDLQWGLNNTVNKGIGRSPSEVLFGLRLTGVSEGLVKSSIGENLSNCDIEGNLQNIRAEVDQHIIADQSKQKERFDKTRGSTRHFQVGDLVRVERSIVCPGKSRKLLSKCCGPYRIAKVLANDRYLVEDTPLTKRKGKAKYEGVYPVDRIYPWLSFQRHSNSEDEKGKDNSENDSSECESEIVTDNNGD